MASTADWPAAKALCPPEMLSGGDVGSAAFLAALEERPEIVYRIIGDIYHKVSAAEERDRGVKRVGRRPRNSQVSLAEVWGAVFPEQFNMDPFPEAMIKLLNGRSQRAFAARIPCHQTTLSRLLSGQLEPDLQMLERIAAAARVKPYYFIEWRAKYISELICEVFMASPNMSVSAVQGVRAMAREVAGGKPGSMTRLAEEAARGGDSPS